MIVSLKMKKRKASEISTTPKKQYVLGGNMNKGATGAEGAKGGKGRSMKKGGHPEDGYGKGKKINIGKELIKEGNKKVDRTIGAIAGSAHGAINKFGDKYGGNLSKPLKGALIGSAHQVVSEGAREGKQFIKKEGKNVFNSAVHHIKEGGKKVGEKISDLWGRAKKRMKIG